MARKSGVGDEIPRCKREPEVVRALGCGELSGNLLQHAEACVVCSEVCTITRHLLLVESSMEEPLESAAGLWWRLNLKMRRQKMERARLPLVWMGRIFAATVLLATCLALWQVSRNTVGSYLLVVGLLGLVAVALPTMIVLWRWSRS
ncbi:MAG TPA: hypothetical protein VHY84_09400 [Bryobacteraceae bacterium]|jgi:hypothetical protein|nr:hypothetical protein [Bryobacteraceae bacterium]